MLNQCVLVGRLVQEVELEERENNSKVANIILAIPRPYKNADGEYETDFINCQLWSGVAQNTAEYCKKGDLLGIKGRIQSENEQPVIIAEKVTFLSNRKIDEEDQNDDKTIVCKED